MQSFINDITGQSSAGFFGRQFLLTVLLWLYGYILIKLIYREKSRDALIMRCLLAFPLALCVFGITSFTGLVAGIPFEALPVTGGMALVLIIAVFLRMKELGAIFEKSLKTDLVAAGIVMITAFISVSGIISVGISNDSMYYYHMYPNALVYFGGYRASFDTFLTDAGQGSAIINALPALFGFDEAFGIQTFFNMDFLLLFAYAVYHETEGYADNKKRFLITLLAFLSLVTAMPFIIISKWTIANVYFMEYMFILVYLMMRYEDKIKEDRGLLFCMALFSLMLSILRIEGAVFVLMLILCFSTLKYTGPELAACFLLPAGLLQAGYYIRIYFTMNMRSEANFMSLKNLMIMIAFFAFVLIYLIFVRGKLFPWISGHFKGALILFLVLVNLLLFLLDRSLYTANLKAFALNLYKQSGWSVFPAVILAGYLLLHKKGKGMNLFDLTAVSYVLMTVAVCFARGGEMRESYADSGNRVLMQVVPLFVFALTLRAIDILREERAIN